MRPSVVTILWIVCLTSSPGIVQPGSGPDGKALRGWLSDEGCARGRATGGAYTATNPDCAKRCVANGAKIVLIVTDQKQILNIANQEAAKSHIGDYVEVTGSIERQGKTLHIDSLKMLAPGRVACDLPRPAK